MLLPPLAVLELLVHGPDLAAIGARLQQLSLLLLLANDLRFVLKFLDRYWVLGRDVVVVVQLTQGALQVLEGGGFELRFQLSEVARDLAKLLTVSGF